MRTIHSIPVRLLAGLLAILVALAVVAAASGVFGGEGQVPQPHSAIGGAGMQRPGSLAIGGAGMQRPGSLAIHPVWGGAHIEQARLALGGEQNPGTLTYIGGVWRGGTLVYANGGRGPDSLVLHV
jgi:hypothetical protein